MDMHDLCIRVHTDILQGTLLNKMKYNITQNIGRPFTAILFKTSFIITLHDIKVSISAYLKLSIKTVRKRSWSDI